MDGFDSYAEWLDVPVDRRPPNHYELLGLKTGECEAARIRAASIERSARVRRYCLGPHGAEATRLLAELGGAFACLSDPERKAVYDRQLRGDAAADYSPDISPPPIQRRIETSDEETPPRRWAVAEKELPVEAGSHFWQRRRREASSSGPGRFAVAAAIVLAATCGAVWSARRPPREVVVRGEITQEVVETAEPAAAPSTRNPADQVRNPPGAKTPPPGAEPSVPPPVVSTDAVSERDDSAGGDMPSNRDARSSDLATARSPDAAGDTVANNTPAAFEAFGLTSQPSAAPAKKDPSGPTPPFIKQDGKQESGRPDVAEEQADQARVLRPDAVWRLRTDDEPELLEVTLENPVDAAHVELLEPSSPAMIDRAVIEAADGSTSELRPVAVPGFFDDEIRIRRWSFGLTRRARTSRFWIRFRPTKDGYVELAGVAVLDRLGQIEFPILVRAVTKAIAHSKSAPDTAQKPAAAKKDDNSAAQQLEPVDAIEELARQELSIVRGRKPRRVAGYVTFLKDRAYVRTKAAIEAVADLVEIIKTAPTTGEVKSARLALKSLIDRYPNGDAAKLAAQALNDM